MGTHRHENNGGDYAKPRGEADLPPRALGAAVGVEVVVIEALIVGVDDAGGITTLEKLPQCPSCAHGSESKPANH
jgi:hypothetical protein